MTRRSVIVWALAGSTGLVIIAAEALLPAVRGGTGRSLWYGIAAAALVLACVLLGLRKRWLRLRLGSVATWTKTHSALGALAFGLGILHCQFQRGGILTSALLLALALVTASGIVGALLQASVPRWMAARLPYESADGEHRVACTHAWQRVHELVVAACGAQPEAGRRLAQAEATAGLASVDLASVDLASAAESTGAAVPESANRRALASFYNCEIVSYLEAPSVRHVPLGTESRAHLAFDALSEGLAPDLRGVVARIAQVHSEVRIHVEERQLRALMLGWQVLHIPFAIVTVVLVLIHGLAAVYY